MLLCTPHVPLATSRTKCGLVHADRHFGFSWLIDLVVSAYYNNNSAMIIIVQSLSTFSVSLFSNICLWISFPNCDTFRM